MLKVFIFIIKLDKLKDIKLKCSGLLECVFTAEEWYDKHIMREKYETELTDEQWDVIAPLFANMRKWDKRELTNVVLSSPCTAFIVAPASTDYGIKFSNIL